MSDPVRARPHIKQLYEKTQAGNPYELPIKQHIFPKRSIERFCSAAGLVQVQHVIQNRLRRAKPVDTTFCAMRVWDAKAERVHKETEDSFQSFASDVIGFRVTSVSQANKYIVDRFFALWKTRAFLRHSERKNLKLNMLPGEMLTKDQEEILEKNGYVFVNKDSEIPHHVANGMQMFLRIGKEMRDLEAVRWGILHALDGNFIVPDNPIFTFIPLTPRIAICADCEGSMISRSVVAEINQYLRKDCVSYFFGLDLSQCP